ncbi:MAG: LysE family translocator [Clostridiales bacterium]|nr:LysE family translocator [Clostridiales bacterium]
MAVELLQKGLVIGLVFGVPAGAIGALTIQRTLEKGFRYGFLTGLGSSAADALYACFGVFGITAITGFLQTNERLISMTGSILIAAYGISLLGKRRETKAETGSGKDGKKGNGHQMKDGHQIKNEYQIENGIHVEKEKLREKGSVTDYGFLSAFCIAIMNPATILSFLTAFSAFGIAGDYSLIQGIALVAGIFVGTAIWWAGLSGGVCCFRRKITDQVYQVLNRILGGLMLAFAGVLFAQNL